VSFIKSFIPDLFAPGNVEVFKNEIEQLKNEAATMKVEAIVAALRGMKVRNDHVKLLSKLEIPVAFIIGKEDVRIPLDKILSQARLPKHSETLILDRVGHMGHIEAREKTLAYVRSFCERTFQSD
ncbi:MAG: alpha/beta hydrolase, partial [Bacteroidales bacterium]|nr:alpha/beta hydrolase [Bacteroidales bacterium]